MRGPLRALHMWAGWRGKGQTKLKLPNAVLAKSLLGMSRENPYKFEVGIDRDDLNP
jgi:hypothetical protein